jgi:[ribosomal protein S5]-alanine N-acetyltransferase
VPSLFTPVVPSGALRDRPQPRIDGDGLALRPWRETDIPHLIAAYQDPEISHWHARTLADEGEAREWLERRQRSLAEETGVDWAIVDPRDDETVLGRAGLNFVDLTEGLGEVAYWVSPGHRRQRVATRALFALSDWAFDDLGLHRLALLHSTHNEPSCRVAQRGLYVLEGTLREQALHPDGWHDMHVHARLATDVGRPSGYGRLTARTGSTARPR